MHDLSEHVTLSMYIVRVCKEITIEKKKRGGSIHKQIRLSVYNTAPSYSMDAHTHVFIDLKT